ncbi:MAG: Ig domain-containing protein, partial [Candidatus Diapherotrites archaeon]|nr:Ig domain-containing protein [Candidatus Diapherotrites archaeon]
MFSNKLIVLIVFFALFAIGCVNPVGVENNNDLDSVSRIIFIGPINTLNAKVGTEFEHSFCFPKPSIGESCGPFSEPINPSGGKPPYEFVQGYNSGLMPPGLKLYLNGVLSGTPTLEGSYEFEVCAKELAGEQDCEFVKIVVEPFNPITIGVHLAGEGGGDLILSPSTYIIE